MKTKKAHLELYKCMQDKHKRKEQFTKSDLLEIYSKFVISNKKVYGYRELTEDAIYNGASTWLNRAISILVRRGYLGLIFRGIPPKREICKNVEVLCQ